MSTLASSLSSETRFDLTRADLVKLALADVGGVGPGKTPLADQKAHANDLLNALAVSLDGKGKRGWRTVRRELALTAALGASYALGTDVWDVDDPMNIRVTGEATRTWVTRVYMDRWMAIGDRTTTGQPIEFMVERTLGTSGRLLTLQFTPTPDASYTVEYVAILKTKQQYTDDNTPDFPATWLRVLRYGLALELCPSYKVPTARVTHLNAQYEKALEDAEAEGNEGGGVRF